MDPFARTHSPRSVLNFVEDEPAHQSLFSPCGTMLMMVNRGRQKRRLSWILGQGGGHVPAPKRSCGTINIRHRMVTEATVDWLASKEHLEELCLGPVFDSSTTMLAAIEKIPPSVTRLDLDLRNRLFLLPEILPLLFCNQTISSLSLRLYGDAGAVELAKWLHLNPNLRSMDLHGNRIGTEGAIAISKAIVKHQLALQHLDLRCNCIEDAAPIQEILEHSEVESLDLSYNLLSDQDVIKLSMGLKNNKFLRSLIIRECHRLTDRSVQALVDCLRDHNSTLQRIQMMRESQTGIQFPTQETLEHWLSLNRTGRSLLKSGEAFDHSPLWPLLLTKSSDNPTTLFHILREGGPQLFTS